MAGFLFLLLLVLGFFTGTRPHTAMFAFILNVAALAFVLSRLRLPRDFDEAVFVLPILLALIGFAWIASPVLLPKPKTRDEAFRS